MKIYDLFPHVCYSDPDSISDIEKFNVQNEGESDNYHENIYMMENDFIINEEPGIGNIGMVHEPIF